MKKLNKLKIKIFADGANLNQILKLKNNTNIKGITTNPSLMRKAGIKNYVNFARELTRKIKHKPISLEVFSDNKKEIIKQAIFLSNLGNNVYVKIPIVNSKGKSMISTIKLLSKKNIRLNITAIMTIEQVKQVVKNLNINIENYISIFSGRIADTGRDPIPTIKTSVKILKKYKKFEIIWASTREVYNIFQANNVKCHIITVGYDFLNKLNMIGTNLNYLSKITSRQFVNDAKKSGFKII